MPAHTTTTYYSRTRKEVVPFLPQRYHTVLEVGCGDGSFSSSSLIPGCEIWGIEPNQTAAEAAARAMRKVLVGKYDEVASSLPAEYFDLIICNDVIEHMPDHDSFLESLKTKMKPGACLIGSIPNVRYYFNLKNLLLKRDWQYTDQGTLDRTHLRFFTQISWKRVLVQHGFIVERLEGINPLYLPSLRPRFALEQLFINAAIVLTLGAWRDIRYLQYGFRAVKS